MKKFTGTKTIKAKPMTLGEYNKYKGWEIPKDEDPEKAGYLVGYPKADGTFTAPLQEGCDHISWSPAEVFEASYIEDSEKTVKIPNSNKILDMFKTHKMSPAKIELSTDLRSAFIGLVTALDSTLPGSREKSLVMTSLEQALFYTTACIARNELPK